MNRPIVFSDLHITSACLLRELGYSKNIEPPEYLSELTEILLSEAESHSNPSYQYVLCNGRCEGDALYIQEKVLRTGKIISATQKKSTSFAVFVATAGTLFQTWQEELEKKGDVMACYMVDCIGSEIAEKVADALQKEVEEISIQRNLSITNRYSPGYCDWNLNDQHILFSLFKGNTGDVLLKDSGLMYPIKSVSGIIGIGSNVRKRPYGCRVCQFPNCFKRKKKQ